MGQRGGLNFWEPTAILITFASEQLGKEYAMLTKDGKKAYTTQGLICLKNLIPIEKVRSAQQAVCSHFEREGLWKEGNWYLDELPSSKEPNAGAKLLTELKHNKEILQLVGEEVHQVVRELMDDHAVLPLLDRVQVLFTLPNAEKWTVPYRHWHLDLPRLPHCGGMGVQIFTFLNTVAPSGGGTLVVRGSHHLIKSDHRVSSSQVKKILKRKPYFRDLMSEDGTDRLRFLQEAVRVDDVDIQVVELCGEPGDVYFTDLRLLHTIAPNASKTPRIMMTQRFLLTSLREALFNGNPISKGVY